jgi:hypothetical protein
MWDELPAVEVEPNALNTFAQGLGDTTSTLARQALAEMPGLSAELGKDASMLNEGISFDNYHRDVALQFVAFLQDVTAGVGALADAANTIALQYTTADELNASHLLNLDDGGGDYSAPKLLQLYDLAGSSAQVNATVDDVNEAFAPTRLDDYNPLLNTLHGYTVAAQPGEPAAAASVGTAAPRTLQNDPVEQARRDALTAARLPAGQGPASTYHQQHGVYLATPEDQPGPAVPLLDSQGRPFQIPGDTSSEGDVEDVGIVDEPGFYQGDIRTLEERLAVVANPPEDDMPGGRR